MKHILRWAAYQLTRKRVDENKLSPIHIRVDKKHLSYFALSTNPIISFDHDGTRCYFRRCPQVVGRRAFFQQAVEGFFETLGQLGIDRRHFRQEIPIRLEFQKTQVEAFRAYITARMTGPYFLKVLYRSDRIWQKTGRSIWDGKGFDEAFFSDFTLGDRPEGTGDVGIYFLWCMRSAAITYPTLRISRGKRWSHFNAVRAVASGIVAEALGLEAMITDARCCTLDTGDGAPWFGVLSQAAPGERMVDSNVGPSGSLQRELGKLFLLDLICDQADHGPNNYNVEMGAQGAVTVCAFDNDNPMTFYPHFTLSRSLAGCSPFVDKKGRVCRPYLDAGTVWRLGALDLKALKRKLSPYLNLLQRLALQVRVEALRRSIQRAQEEGETILLEDADWGPETVERESSGAFGQTYLTKVMEKRS